MKLLPYWKRVRFLAEWDKTQKSGVTEIDGCLAARSSTKGINLKKSVVAQSKDIVTGASGYVGSWLVMKLLREGYTVRATVRDPSNEGKMRPLLELPESDERLTIWKADLDEEGSFDEVVKGCEGVFHVATPMDFESKDPENEIIKPTVRGMVSIMRSCEEAGTVRRVVFTSSAGTVNMQEQQMADYDEHSWSDIDFCRRLKMTGWMYFVSKTLAEKAAMEFAQKHGIHFISIVPTLVVGPFITTSMPPSMITALSLITGNEAHYSILKQVQLVHLDDLCDAHIFLYEHPGAEGRFICSSNDRTIYDLATMFRDRYPQYIVPHKFEGIDEKIERVHFSSEKLRGLGFEFKYSVEDMFDSAIQACLEKKLLPSQTVQEQEQSSEVLKKEKEKEKKKKIAASDSYGLPLPAAGLIR